MSLKLPYNIEILNPLPVDYYYYNGSSPYADADEVNSTIASDLRYKGLTVNVDGTEYWYSGGTANENLVKKRMPFRVEYGTKDSVDDAGTAGDLSYDDDYLYICVATGGEGDATWKKVILTTT